MERKTYPTYDEAVPGPAGDPEVGTPAAEEPSEERAEEIEAAAEQRREADRIYREEEGLPPAYPDEGPEEPSPKGSAAGDPRWAEDPSPSFNESAERAGVEPPTTSPELPGSDTQWQTQAFWPGNPLT